jgi:hypothetical protein
LSLTISDVEWINVLNMRAFFSVSCTNLTDTPSVEDLTGPKGPQGPPVRNGASEWSDISNKPTWVAPSQGSVIFSGLNHDLYLTTISDVEWAGVLNKPVVFLSGSYNDLTDTPSVEDLTGPQGPQGPPVINGASEWSDISNNPTTCVATSERGVNFPGFNNDMPFTVGDVEWADVLKKPALFSHSYYDLSNALSRFEAWAPWPREWSAKPARPSRPA